MSKYTPITELPRTLEEDSKIAWQLEPGMYVAQEKIGLHSGRTEAVIKMAGFSGLIVKNYFGEQTQFDTGSVAIAGMNADNTAIGSGEAAVARAKTEKASLQEDNPLLDSTCRWPVAVVDINRSELASRISTRITRGAPQDQAWAAELDRSLRRGLRSAAWQKLCKDFSNSRDYEPLMTSITLTSTSIVLGKAAMTDHNYWPFGLITGVFHVLGWARAVDLNRQHIGHAHPEWRRLSLFPWGPQPDRLALASGMLAAGKLVRYLG